jgi:hypothetical protein
VIRPPTRRCFKNNNSLAGSGQTNLNDLGLPFSRSGSPPGGETSAVSTQLPPRAV